MISVEVLSREGRGVRTRVDNLQEDPAGMLYMDHMRPTKMRINDTIQLESSDLGWF
jgi:hypothetical protein